MMEAVAQSIAHALAMWVLVNLALLLALAVTAVLCNTAQDRQQRRQQRRQRDAELARAIREAEGRGRALLVFERQQGRNQ